MANRKAVYDAVRRMLNRGFTQAEVEELDGLLDGLDTPDAPETVPVAEWERIAIPLIQEFEGYAKALPDGRVKSYWDAHGEVWTIGFGSTGAGVGASTVWTRDQAEDRFRSDLRHFSDGVRKALNGSPASGAQFAAMVSMAYNCGLANFRGSTLLKLHRKGDFAGAQRQFGRWIFSGGRKLAGLVRRRKAEAAIYGRGA